MSWLSLLLWGLGLWLVVGLAGALLFGAIVRYGRSALDDEPEVRVKQRADAERPAAHVEVTEAVS